MYSMDNRVMEKSELLFQDNLLSKNELKLLFKEQYKNITNINLANLVNRCQCFRNTAIFLIMRMEALIWKKIDELPDNATYDTLLINDKNKYLILQTLIELLDNRIINKVMNNYNENDRTKFLDTRLSEYDIVVTDEMRKIEPDQELTLPIIHIKGEFKYRKLGLTNNLNIESSNKLNAIRMGIDYSEYIEMIDKSCGGEVSEVIRFLYDNIFDKGFLYNTNYNLEKLHENFEATDKEYILIQLNKNISIFDFLKTFDNFKSKSGLDGKKYRLVAITYDCYPKQEAKGNDDIPHQFISFCYGDDSCNHNAHYFRTDNLSYKINTDQTYVITSDLFEAPTMFDYSCRNGAISVEFLLYENVDAIKTIYASSIKGGNSKYKHKYLKYKKKYLNLYKKIELYSS